VVQILLQIVLISVLVFGLVQWLLLDQDFYDTKEKAEILNRQYFSVFTPENTDEQLPPLNDNFQSMPENCHLVVVTVHQCFQV
jgi:hypothetical protein